MPYGILAADQISTSVTGVSLGAGNATRFKNKIINGDCRIDQRNAGASVAVSNATNTFITDRWSVFENTSGAFSWQQVTDAPTGFINSLKCTVTTANSSPSSADFCQVKTTIEGLNISDLAWGTANAKTVTLSFWVKSSLTGQFGGAFGNSGTNRSYPFTYTISSASTWTQISVTILGDTSGTWLTDTGVGIYAFFDMGAGSTLLGTAGSWAATDYRGATGDTKVMSTLSATWQITGVQLEVGSSATGFEYVDYGVQLGMCQRYFYQGALSGSGCSSGATSQYNYTKFPQVMRTTPTITWISGGRVGTGTVDTAITGLSSVIGGTTNDAILTMTTGTFGSGGAGLVMYQSPIFSLNAEL